MDAAKLNNVAIVSVSEAARLGRITDVMFKTDPLRVSALKASGDSGDFTVPMNQIASIGPDAVMVEKPSVRQPPAGGQAGDRSLAELTSMKVVDEDGRYLGVVRTIEIDPRSGDVEQILAGEGGMLGVGGSHAAIRPSAVRGIGSDLMTVASSAAPEIAAADQNENGGDHETQKEEEPA